MGCKLKAFSLVFLFSALALAQFEAPMPPGGVPGGTMSVSIDKIHVVGRGLVINPEEPTDFKLMKIIVASVVIPELEEEFGLGLIILDEKKYKLTNIEKTETKATADVYDKKTKVGDLSLTKVKKLDVELWAGTVTIEKSEFFAYVLGVARDFKPEETGDKIGEFCMKNPEKCVGASKEQCMREPFAEPCQRVLRNYCAENQDDIRCRGHIGDYCEKNPGAPECSQALPPLKCLQCVRPFAEACGMTNELCNWDKVTEMTPPTCPPPTEEVMQCMMKSAGMQQCASFCMETAMPTPMVAPGAPPGVPAAPEFVTPIGGKMCRKEVREVCEEMRYEEPVGPMSCEEAQGRNCEFKCVGKDGRVDPGCMFECKSGGIRSCRTTDFIRPAMPDFGKPCTPPYMCGNKYDLEKRGCTEVREFSCGASEIVCMKCPPPKNGGYMCPAMWEPVCGADGKTYPNPCHAKSAGVQIKYGGQCGITPIQPPAFCGNMVCEPGEATTCPADCMAHPQVNVTPVYKPVGSPCVGGAECETGYCTAGYCSTTPTPPPTVSTCGDGTPVGSCSATTSMYRCNAFAGYNQLVYDSTCGPATGAKPIGSTCTLNNECATGFCSGGYCASSTTGTGTKPLGSTCTYSYECASTYCSAGICSSMSTAKKYFGSPCASNTECESDICSGGYCAQGTKTGGMTCHYSSQCAVNYYCSGYPGVCTVSTYVSPATKSVGQTCTTNAECMSGICGAGGTCAQGTKTKGTSCMYTDECAVGYPCTNGVCGGTTATACGDGTASGMCSTGTPGYRCQYSAGVYSLMPDSTCGGGALKANGAACLYGNECQSTFCVNGYCSATSGTTMKPSGAPCASAADCQSAICYMTNMTCA